MIILQDLLALFEIYSIPNVYFGTHLVYYQQFLVWYGEEQFVGYED